MDAGLFFQLLINGLMSGGMYAIVASGFTLILGVMQVFNMSQGHFYMLGAYMTYAAAVVMGLPYPIAMLVSLVSMMALGIAFHYSVIKWTMPHGFFHMMLATIAFGNIISQVSLLTFGYDEQVVPAVWAGNLVFGSLTLSKGKLLVIIGAIVVMVVLYNFMKTKVGIAMLASAENTEVAELQGINTSRVFWVTVAVGCGLCGIAGALIVPVISANTLMGGNIFIRLLLVVLVGGSGSMAGALLAAFIIGTIESFAFQFVGQMNLLVLFIFVAILMYFRPGGLLGKPLPVPGE